MKVIPVLDILNGIAVHAVRGKRKEYSPLISVISDSPNPQDVAKAFARLGFTELYIADLNAIMGNGESLAVIEQIGEVTGLKLLVDAGVANTSMARTILLHGASKVIVGTETLTDVGFVQQAVQTLGSDRVVVSLDVKNGRLLNRFNFEKNLDPVYVLQEFRGAGLTQVILLDLGRVGSGEGIDWDLLQKVQTDARMAVYVGGGVRGMKDLLRLKEKGVVGVLVATSLHSGNITVDDIRHAGLST